jgi:ribosomal protein S18 acetylase RimI-like enzyme
VTAASLPDWRALRLRALATDGHAYGTTYEESAARSDADWQSWLSNVRGLMATNDQERPVRIAGVVLEPGEEQLAQLISMWVEPSARGTGAGDALVQAAIDQARALDATRLQLYVADGNEPALRLYERNGFALTGAKITRERDGAIEHEMSLTIPS